MGTVIFPVLTRHAERGDWQRLRDGLSLGLPASADLWLLAEPLAVVLIQRGQVTGANARQIAEIIAAYGLGVWAFCGLLIVQRGYCAIGDRITPLMIGLSVVVVNLLLNFGLNFVIGDRGLALSTSLVRHLAYRTELAVHSRPCRPVAVVVAREQRGASGSRNSWPVRA